MVYQYFAQARSENHHLVRTCYLIVNLSPVRANVARGIRVRPENHTESLQVRGLCHSAFFYFAFIFPFLTLYFKKNYRTMSAYDFYHPEKSASSTLTPNIATFPLDLTFA